MSIVLRNVYSEEFDESVSEKVRETLKVKWQSSRRQTNSDYVTPWCLKTHSAAMSFLTMLNHLLFYFNRLDLGFLITLAREVFLLLDLANKHLDHRDINNS